MCTDWIQTPNLVSHLVRGRCQHSPLQIKVALLRELSLTDYHASFGWEKQGQPGQQRQRHPLLGVESTGEDQLTPAPPPQSQPPSGSRHTTPKHANEQDIFAADAPAATRGTEDSETIRYADSTRPFGDTKDYGGIPDRPLPRRRSVSWFRGISMKQGQGGVGMKDGGTHEEGTGDDGGDDGYDGWDSATSGLGFMSALQRVLCRQKGSRTGREKDRDGDRHALELLNTIAACCEVRWVFLVGCARRCLPRQGARIPADSLHFGAPSEGAETLCGMVQNPTPS